MTCFSQIFRSKNRSAPFNVCDAQFFLYFGGILKNHYTRGGIPVIYETSLWSPWPICSMTTRLIFDMPGRLLNDIFIVFCATTVGSTGLIDYIYDFPRVECPPV